MVARRPDDGLARWLEDEGIVPVAEGPGAIADVGRVRGLLLAAARKGRALSYSELLGHLGHRFTRPKMRALCRTLDVIDTAATAAGEPALAVLVVRESDRLPGQGWWVGRTDAPAWEGPVARAYVEERQRAAFAYWASRWSGQRVPESTESSAIVRADSGSPNATACRRS